ncbi:MAG TPA: hypothetical protein VGL68_07655 [Solirubrobacteraceae bacterium]
MTYVTRRLHAIPRSASPEEGAAIVAAIERFMRATAPGPTSAANDPDPWLRAAILEGVAREDSPDVPDPWINP